MKTKITNPYYIEESWICTCLVINPSFLIRCTRCMLPRDVPCITCYRKTLPGEEWCSEYCRMYGRKPVKKGVTVIHRDEL